MMKQAINNFTCFEKFLTCMLHLITIPSNSIR